MKYPIPYSVPNVSVKNSTEIAVAIATRMDVKNLGMEAGMRISRKILLNVAPNEYKG